MCSSTKSEQGPIDTLGKVGRNAMGSSRVVDSDWHASRRDLAFSAGSPGCRISEETSRRQHERTPRHNDGRHPCSARAAARETPTESGSARPVGPTCRAKELARPHPRQPPRLRYPARPPLPDPRLRRIGTSGAGRHSRDRCGRHGRPRRRGGAAHKLVRPRPAPPHAGNLHLHQQPRGQLASIACDGPLRH